MTIQDFVPMLALALPLGLTGFFLSIGIMFR